MNLLIVMFALFLGFGFVESQTFALQVADVQDQNTRVAAGDPVDEPGNNLMLLYQDKKNNFWFGTWGDGLYRFDGKSTVRFTTKHGLCHNRIDEILEDKAGNLYFNTSSGISRFDGKVFSTLPVSNESKWMLNADDLWFKCPLFSGMVYRYDGKLLHALALPKIELGENYIAKHPGLPSPYAVYTVYRDNQKNVWFGTGALGVCRYDGKSFEWISGDDVNELHNGPSNGIRSMIEDREGLFWFNTLFRYRINRSNPASDANSGGSGFFSRIPGIGSLDGKPEGDFHEYMSITKDNNSNLWMATYGGGVFHYDGVELKHHPVMEGSQVVTLFSIYKDNDGNIWLGTHEHGAYRFDGKSFVRFRTGSR